MIEADVPKFNPSPFTKQWWSKELSQKCKEVWKLGRSSYAKRSDPDDPAHREYKVARNSYGSMMDIVKRTHWEEFLQSVDDKTIWTTHHYASGAPTDGGKAQVPTLNLKTWDTEPTSVAVLKRRLTHS